jgi:diguanylate cyclase (GGDEF)-like protein
MNGDTLEKILSCPSLPSLPAVAVRVIELTSDPDLVLADLASTIQNDQGLSAKILRTVNSSFYGLRKKCATIHQALVVLGMASVKSLALGFSLVECLDDPDDSCFDYVGYWRRGLYTAVGAKIVASKAGKDFADEAFLAGLLQDIGMVAIYRSFDKDYVALLAKADGDSDIVNVELGEYELTHCDIGSMLAARWQMPDQFVSAIKYHHAATAAPLDMTDLVRCVHIAGLIHDALTEEDPAQTVVRLRRLCVDWFDMTREQADDVLKETAEAAVEMSGLFKLDTGNAADYEQVLENAQKQLLEASKQLNEDVQVQTMNTLLLDSQRMDPITGAMTRAAFDAAIREQFQQAREYETDLCVMLVLIDSFPKTEEADDQSATDEAVVTTAALLRSHFEPAGASISRWADSAFALVVPGCTNVAAMAMATEFRHDLQRGGRAWRFGESGHEVPATASIGAAVLDTGSAHAFQRVEQLMSGCARALQAVRTDGGDGIRIFMPKKAA